ncbi:hypothetical protein VR46_41795, partial [Streptomyces sp. NRRL S-444]
RPGLNAEDETGGGAVDGIVATPDGTVIGGNGGPGGAGGVASGQIGTPGADGGDGYAVIFW